MLSGGAGQSDDGVAVDADEASGGADAAALVEVLEDGEGLLLGEVAAVQRRALAFGEAGPAGVAVELAELLVLAVAAADREVAGVASAVERTVGILAAEAGEVVHGGVDSWDAGRDAIRGWKRKDVTHPTSNPSPWFNWPGTPPESQESIAVSEPVPHFGTKSRTCNST